MLVESKKKTRWNKMKRESERRPRRKEDDYERLDAGFSLRSFFYSLASFVGLCRPKHNRIKLAFKNVRAANIFFSAIERVE